MILLFSTFGYLVSEMGQVDFLLKVVNRISLIRTQTDRVDGFYLENKNDK